MKGVDEILNGAACFCCDRTITAPKGIPAACPVCVVRQRTEVKLFFGNCTGGPGADYRRFPVRRRK